MNTIYVSISFYVKPKHLQQGSHKLDETYAIHDLTTYLFYHQLFQKVIYMRF